jgi:tagatose-6-phosphate ketose/aldose isomerase
VYIYNEITQQPDLWKKIYNEVAREKELLLNFLNDVLNKDGEVIFTGAGSSFFVGEMVAGYFQEMTGISSRAVSTTEIVTHPLQYIPKNKPVLLVSLARSGNSPESVAAANLAQQTNPDLAHLIITCNRTGRLAVSDQLQKKLVFLLPDEANDKALAMTSSVTSMALVAILLANIKNIEQLEGNIDKMALMAESFFINYSDKLESIAANSFERAVFLGSGPFYGLAREAHLKLQEMTDGQLIAKFDSFLGFRHGPKAVVNNKTLVVYFLSSDDYVQQYEIDLIKAVSNDKTGAFTIGIGTQKHKNMDFDLLISMADKDYCLNDIFLMLVYLLPVQLFSVYKALDYNLDPDAPSRNGTIHRVVQGVNIYEYKIR